MKAGPRWELGVEGMIQDTVSGWFERFVCVACMCVWGPLAEARWNEGKEFCGLLLLKLNIADTWKPEPLLHHLETQTFNLSKGCKNLFCMQMLGNYSRAVPWAVLSCYSYTSHLLWGIFNSLLALSAWMLLSVVPGILLTLRKELKNSRKLFLFPSNGVWSKGIKMAVDKRKCCSSS